MDNGVVEEDVTRVRQARKRPCHNERELLTREEDRSLAEDCPPRQKRKRVPRSPRQSGSDGPAEASEVLAFYGAPCRQLDCYEDLRFVDEGSYGFVYQARDSESGALCALKQVKLDGQKEGFPITALREIGLLLSLRHENVVYAREVVLGSAPNGIAGESEDVFIVMEYAEHDLHSILQRMRNPYSQSEIKSLLMQLLRGLAYVHSRWVLHRDLKPSNLLINDEGVLKICDFGLARKFGSPSGEMSPGVTTLWYRAPEILLGAKTYTAAIDMWSVGCIFFELLQREALFRSRGELDQIMKIFDLLGAPTEANWPGLGKLPNANRLALRGPATSMLRSKFEGSAASGHSPLTSLGFELLESMLTCDPESRVTASQALQHPYFDEAPPAKAPHLIQTFPPKRRE